MNGEGDVFWHQRALRAEARALRAEDKLAQLDRMLDGYRDKNRPMPTYSDLIRVLGS